VAAFRTASFILGLVAAVALVVPFAPFVSPIAGVAAIELGIPGLSKAHRAGGSGKAIAGISLGSIALAVSLVIIFLLRHVLWRLFIESGAW
jgi:hypothetical protein